MNALVIGSGGREHALAWKLSQSPLIRRVFALPGNPGIAQVATCLPPCEPTPEAWLAAAEAIGADLTVVGPEAPLVAGIVDVFRASGRKIIGPTAAAAQLEGSKVFSKDFLRRHGIPTARAEVAPDASSARSLVDAFGFPVVLKADGLAAGKGVVIARDRDEALAALQSLPAGRVLVEEFLTGEECSFIVLADRDRAIPLAATQDHKAVHDGDTGPNTGGMGAYCDGRILDAATTARVLQSIIRPTLDGMIADGVPYTGFLYAGLMLTNDGPKVLEFNARLGDPETQPLLHRMSNDLAEVLLEGEPFQYRSDPSVCVVLAAHNYPGTPRTGDLIHGLDSATTPVFHAGTRSTADGIVTAGGRVLGVTASGPNLAEAIANVYRAVEGIHFDGMHYRKDIGQKGLRRW